MHCSSCNGIINVSSHEHTQTALHDDHSLGASILDPDHELLVPGISEQERVCHCDERKANKSGGKGDNTAGMLPLNFGIFEMDQDIPSIGKDDLSADETTDVKLEVGMEIANTDGDDGGSSHSSASEDESLMSLDLAGMKVMLGDYFKEDSTYSTDDLLSIENDSPKLEDVARSFVKKEAKLLWQGIGGQVDSTGTIVKEENKILEMRSEGQTSNLDENTSMSTMEDAMSEVEKKRRSRRKAIERFRAKRANRSFQKRVRYACRKQLADSRPRVKGRFVKKSEMKLFNHFGPKYRKYLFLLDKEESQWDSLIAKTQIADDDSSIVSGESEEDALVPGAEENSGKIIGVDNTMCVP